MQGEVTISIDPKILEKLDKLRGDVPREEFLEKLLAQVLSSREGTGEDKDEIPEVYPPEEQTEEAKSAAVDEIISTNLQTILSKMDQIEELNARIKELESKQAKLERSGKESGEPAEVVDRDSGKESESAESEVVFKIADEIDNEEDEDDDIEFEVTDSDFEDYDEEFNEEYEREFGEEAGAGSAAEAEEYDTDDDGMDSAETYKFTYGCARCGSTVSEREVNCPSCGEMLEDVPAEINWLENIGRKYEAEFPDDRYEDTYYDDYDYDEYDEPYEDSYDGSHDKTYDDDYDPSPGGRSRDHHDYRRQTSDRNGYRVSEPEPQNEARPFCDKCGGETDYISRYDRFYCNRCNQYVHRGEPATVHDADRLKGDRSELLERILSRRQAANKEKGGGGDKPLSHYGPYASSDRITHISMLDGKGKEAKRKRR